MVYQASARKHRPQNFSDMTGQEHVARILINSIVNDSLAHAFLLTGTHGTGKTTIGRLLAKSVSCEKRDKDTAEPCNECENCKLITALQHPDVLEIDAASHTGVDDIRNLSEMAHYAPIKGRFKIFIIDEAHMLSNSAFNALLKLLEEPAPHLKFVLATTELHKVPVTVVSRCQHLNLLKIDREKIADRLEKVALEDKTEFEREALDMIAELSNGSMRDAFSLYDSVISYNLSSDKKLDIGTVRNVTGFFSSEDITTLIDALLSGDTNSALDIFEKTYAISSDVSTVLNCLLHSLYIITKTLATNKIPETSLIDKQYLQEKIIGKVTMNTVTLLWQTILRGLQEIKTAPDSFITAEIIIMQACYVSSLPNIAQVVSNKEKSTDIQKAAPLTTKQPEEKKKSMMSTQY